MPPLHLTLPSCLHVMRAAGAGGDGKEEGRKSSLSFAFLLPTTPLAALRRDGEGRLGTSQPLLHPCANSDEWKMKVKNKSRWRGISITRWQNKRTKPNRNCLFSTKKYPFRKHFEWKCLHLHFFPQILQGNSAPAWQSLFWRGLCVHLLWKCHEAIGLCLGNQLISP